MEFQNLNVVSQNTIMDRTGEVRGTLLETVDGTLQVHLFDHFGRDRIGLVKSGDDFGAMLFDDYQKPRLFLKLENGRPTILIYDAQGKQIASLIGWQAQGALVESAPDPN